MTIPHDWLTCPAKLETVEEELSNDEAVGPTESADCR